MPTSTTIAKYPEGMLDIIESVCETRTYCDITYPTTIAARAERLKFYGLIRALVINDHSLAHKASRLELKLFGQDKKQPNVLRIGFPENDVNNNFYTSIAAKHNSSNPFKE